MDAPQLSTGGRALWDAVTELHPDLDPAQFVQLVEACRAKDRLDFLSDRIDRDEFDEKLASLANQTANQMKQLLAAMRLPDASGARPQQRGGARGAYSPKESGTTAATKAKARWGA